jgi:uncharacterized protein (DUF952 family)
MLVFKILRPVEWARFESQGQFDGSTVDFADGFIHLSSRGQIAATAARFFVDDPELVVVALTAEDFGDQLRWEPAGSGELFPHAYTPLTRAQVVAVHHVAGAARVEQSVPQE